MNFRDYFDKDYPKIDFEEAYWFVYFGRDFRKIKGWSEAEVK